MDNISIKKQGGINGWKYSDRYTGFLNDHPGKLFLYR